MTARSILVATLLLSGPLAQGRVPGEWKSLFDGKTSAGWRGFKKEAFPEFGWVIEEGCIRHLPKEQLAGRRPGDIVTVAEFGNFELEVEWRISPGGNSG